MHASCLQDRGCFYSRPYRQAAHTLRLCCSSASTSAPANSSKLRSKYVLAACAEQTAHQIEHAVLIFFCTRALFLPCPHHPCKLPSHSAPPTVALGHICVPSASARQLPRCCPCWFTRECMPPRVPHLRARADGHGLVVVVGARGAVVEQVRPRLVMACRQHAHTIGPLPAALRCHLCPVCQVAHQSRHLDRLLKHKPAGRCKEICFKAVCRYRRAYTTVNCLVCA